MPREDKFIPIQSCFYDLQEEREKIQRQTYSLVGNFAKVKGNEGLKRLPFPDIVRLCWIFLSGNYIYKNI